VLARGPRARRAGHEQRVCPWLSTAIISPRSKRQNLRAGRICRRRAHPIRRARRVLAPRLADPRLALATLRGDAATLSGHALDERVVSRWYVRREQRVDRRLRHGPSEDTQTCAVLYCCTRRLPETPLLPAGIRAPPVGPDRSGRLAPLTPCGPDSHASAPASTASTPPPTGPYAPGAPGVPGVSVAVGVKVGVMVIGAGRVGVGVRVLRSAVGSSAAAVSDASGVGEGVSVATIGSTRCCPSPCRSCSGVSGVSRVEPHPRSAPRSRSARPDARMFESLHRRA